MKHIILFTCLAILTSSSIAQPLTGVENRIGGLTVGLDRIEEAKELLGTKYYLYKEDPPGLATYAWFDKNNIYNITIQCATTDTSANGIINTITLRSRVPEVLFKIDKAKHRSKVRLNKLQTSKGIALNSKYYEMVKLYSRPTYIDTSMPFGLSADIRQCRYVDTRDMTPGVFEIQYERKTNRVTALEVHYVDW